MCLQHLLGLLLGVTAERILPLLPVALGIHIDADMALNATVDGVVSQMLESIQGVATAADQVTQILAGEFYHIGIVLFLPGVGNSGGAHMLQQTLQELLNLLFHRSGSSRGVLLGSNRGLLHLRLALLGFFLLGRGLGSLHLGCFHLGFFLCHRLCLGLGTGSRGQRHLGSGVRCLIGHLYLGRGCANAQKTGLGLRQHLNRYIISVQTQLSQGIFDGFIDGFARSNDGFFH